MTESTAAARPRASVLRRAIVGVIIVSFGLAALGGIVVLLGASLGDPAWKVLATTAIVGAFSVAVLCCAALLGRRLQTVGVVGATVSVLAAALSVVAVWWQPDWRAEIFWDLLWTLIAASVALSFGSLLLLLADRRQRAVRVGLLVTLALFALLFALVVYPIWTNMSGGDAYSRAVGITAILAALGAVVVPVLSLLMREPAAGAEHADGRLSPSTIALLETEAARRGVTPDELVADLIRPGDASASGAPGP